MYLLSSNISCPVFFSICILEYVLLLAYNNFHSRGNNNKVVLDISNSSDYTDCMHDDWRWMQTANHRPRLYRFAVVRRPVFYEWDWPTQLPTTVDSGKSLYVPTDTHLMAKCVVWLSDIACSCASPQQQQRMLTTFILLLLWVSDHRPPLPSWAHSSSWKIPVPSRSNLDPTK